MIAQKIEWWTLHEIVIASAVPKPTPAFAAPTVRWETVGREGTGS